MYKIRDFKRCHGDTKHLRIREHIFILHPHKNWRISILYEETISLIKVWMLIILFMHYLIISLMQVEWTTVCHHENLSREKLYYFRLIFQSQQNQKCVALHIERIILLWNSTRAQPLGSQCLHDVLCAKILGGIIRRIFEMLHIDAKSVRSITYTITLLWFSLSEDSYQVP